MSDLIVGGSLPDIPVDIREKLAELELELSEGKFLFIHCLFAIHNIGMREKSLSQ